VTGAHNCSPIQCILSCTPKSTGRSLLKRSWSDAPRGRPCTLWRSLHHPSLDRTANVKRGRGCRAEWSRPFTRKNEKFGSLPTGGHFAVGRFYAHVIKLTPSHCQNVVAKRTGALGQEHTYNSLIARQITTPTGDGSIVRYLY